MKWNLVICCMVAAMAICFLTTPTARAQQGKGESLLNKGDSIQVYVDAEDFEALKATKAGDKAKIKILANVERFGKKLIAKSEPVYVTITKRGKGGMYGGTGSLAFRVDSTRSTAKTMIPMKGAVTLKGKGNTVKKVVSIVLFPIGWLIKGADVDFPEGKNVFKSVVTEDTPVDYLK
jgi:hypothetical protein